MDKAFDGAGCLALCPQLSIYRPTDPAHKRLPPFPRDNVSALVLEKILIAGSRRPCPPQQPLPQLKRHTIHIHAVPVAKLLKVVRPEKQKLQAVEFVDCHLSAPVARQLDQASDVI